MIVGLYSDYPQSGKSTVKDTFVAAGFKHLSFAQPVKESLEVVLIHLGISAKDVRDYLYGDKKGNTIPQLNCTGGYLMSHYATTFFREMICNDVWLEALQRKVTRTGLYVVDDLRFYNEYRYIIENGFVVKIVRQNAEKNHGRSAKSEGLLTNQVFDYTIHNYGTLEELRTNAQKVVDGILLEASY